MRNDFQIFVKQIPALRILAGIVSGILLQEYFSFSLHFLICVLIAFGLFFISYNFLSLKKKFAYRWTIGLIIITLLSGIGALIHYINNDTHYTNWVGNTDSIESYEIVIKQPLEAKPKTFKTLGEVTNVFIGQEWKPARGKVLLYFRNDSIPRLSIGSVIITNKPLQLIKNAGNPGEFNYQRYSRRNNIYYQSFFNQKEYKVATYNVSYPLKSWLNNLRNGVMSIIDKYINGRNERAVAKALLIGYRKEIDRELYQSFTNTGVVHIIAISGMHLAMIYAAMLVLLKPLRKKNNGKLIGNIITLIVIWLFTLLAGFVPSIARAAVMFSFIIIGETMQRKTNIYNSLAASAVVLLLINSYNLWDVGFLLSYTAVLSIVIFQRPVNQWLYIENKLLRAVWNVISVTVSAQILTLPVILYYFHQFPVMFIISNLIAVPLSGLILYLEVLLIILSPVPLIAAWCAFATEKLLTLFNEFINYLNRNPFAFIDNIHINGLQVLLLFTIILLLYQSFINKKRKFLYPVGLLFIAIFGIYFIDRNKYKQQKKVLVYNVSQNVIINFIDGHSSFILAKDSIQQGSATDNYVIQPSHYHYFTRQVNHLSNLKLSYPFIHFNDYKIFVVNRKNELPAIPDESMQLVIFDSYNDDIEPVRLLFPRAEFVFSNTNRFWKVDQWKKECNSLHLRCHSTAQDGAFIMNVQ